MKLDCLVHLVHLLYLINNAFIHDKDCQRSKEVRNLKGFSSSVVFLTLFLLAAPAFAQSEQGETSRVFGHGQPRHVADLPAGKLRNRLRSLPPQASARALRWLQDFSFPETDLENIEIDNSGGVFYGDTLLPDAARFEAANSVDAPTPDAVPSETLADAFLLHSRPGSANVVYIDFDGATITGTAWNSSNAQFMALPFNVEGDGATFSDMERARIVDIWHRVAEDFAPYDIDVTTERPDVFTSTTGTILVTHSIDANGQAIACTSCGGVAYVNVFGRSNYHTYYSPALVFFDKLGGGVETFVAEASSHEFGHNLGLSHDGTSTGISYYEGQGSGLVSWAPIMGNSYYNNVTEWSKGEYPNANQTQDDLAIIDGKLGYVPDDHGNTPATATYLAVDANGTVVASNPELDPYDTLPENKGVIGSADDIDVFSFVAGAGNINLTINPSWDAFYRTSRRGANLDIEAELVNQAGATVAYDEPVDDTNAVISASVSAGTYYLLISGAGNALTPYSDYDSLGHYYINGSIPAGVADNTAPTPDPMVFAVSPATVSESAISMTATTAVDDVSAVQYKFLCVAGDQQCSNASSGWQSSRTFTATGLTAGTAYSFQTVARDLSGNETGKSPVATATTTEPPPPPPYTNYFATGETAVAGTVSGNYASTFNDDGSTQNITETESGGKPSSRYSYLEHRWNFNLSPGATVTLFANAWSSGSGDGDAFRFEYSVNNGSSFAALFSVSSTSGGNLQSADLPGSPGGSIIIRVVDTNHTGGNRELNTLRVDQMYIQVGNPVNDPPNGKPSGLNAEAVAHDRIDLSWTNGSDNESGLKVERSPDGASGWSVIADLPAASNSYSDTGLAAETTYYYRVSAYTQPQLVSVSGIASDTTPTAPLAPELSLTATGYKSRGQYHVSLAWSGSASVNIYRDNVRIATVDKAGSFDDAVGKGGGTYRHKVCDTTTGACSNVTTTAF